MPLKTQPTLIKCYKIWNCTLFILILPEYKHISKKQWTFTFTSLIHFFFRIIAKSLLNLLISLIRISKAGAKENLFYFENYISSQNYFWNSKILSPKFWPEMKIIWIIHLWYIAEMSNLQKQKLMLISDILHVSKLNCFLACCILQHINTAYLNMR